MPELPYLDAARDWKTKADGDLRSARAPTVDAAEILRRRYIGDDPKRRASVEEERVHAKVARRIYDLRTEAGLTQAELAERVGTTQFAISRLESADY